MNTSNADFDDRLTDTRPAAGGTQLDAESMATLRTMRRAAGVGPMIFALSGTWVFVLVRLFVVPHFKKIFADFGTSLPTSTELLIGTPTWVVFGSALAATGALIAIHLTVRDIRARLIVMYLASIASASAVIVAILVLYLPMVKLMESVS